MLLVPFSKESLERQAANTSAVARLLEKRASTMEREVAETFLQLQSSPPQQTTNQYLTFFFPRGPKAAIVLGEADAIHHVFFMTVVSSLRDVKHVALRAKQRPHHLPHSPWESSILTNGPSIIITDSKQVRQHVQQKKTARKYPQRCQFAFAFYNRGNIQTVEGPGRSSRGPFL